MNKVFEFIRDRHQHFFKVFLFLASIGIIVFFFPREGKFKYEFQKGKPWPHQDLIASFDFPIYKSEAQLDEEKTRVIEDQQYYFFESGKIREEVLVSYSKNFEKTWNKLFSASDTVENYIQRQRKNEYLSKGQALLEKIYQKGIIELHAEIENKAPYYEIYVLRNNVAESITLEEVYTVNQAYAYINESLTKYNDLEERLLLESLEESLKRNVTFDQETNDDFKQQALEKISPTSGMIQEGERIIAKGDILNDNRHQIIESLKTEYESQLGEKSSFSWILVGQIILVFFMILSFAMFLLSFRKEIIQSDLKVSFLLLLVVLFTIASKYALDKEQVSIYLVPFCMLPLIIRTFFDIRLALFTYLVTILIVGFIAPNPYEFIIIQMIGGIITLFSVVNLNKRAQLFVSALIVFGVYSAVYLAIGLVQEGSWVDTNWKYLGWFLISALLTLFTYPLVYVFEKIFGFVSDVTLMELADTNSKLLRKLSMKAPGTFQHSLQVSNLAEEAIRVIGGNPLLIRTGALYHDIGKMQSPNYFIENQNSDYNPHDDLDPEESAKIIIEHVIMGVEMARRYKLPDVIVDFIRTHHGTTKTQYFYKKYKEKHPEEEINEELFTYPGPVPYSKETAVLMMADSVEAASKSMSKYNGKTIDTLVNTIIDHQISENQFVMANITFSDITLIKKMFKKKLRSIYHIRVEYPE